MSKHDEVHHIEDPHGISKLDATAEAAAEHIKLEQGLSTWASIKLYRKAVFWACMVSMTLVMEGYDKALIGKFWALTAFAERYGVYVPAKGTYTVEAKWQSGITNATTVASFIGIFLGGYQIDYFGYRKTVIANVAFMIPCIAIVTFAPNKIALLFGEMLCGFPWGVLASLGPAYASEVAPIHLRAYLTTYVNLCWVMGQFIASGVVLGISDRTDEWAYRIPFAVQWVWPVLLIPVLWFAPESPWWYVRKGRLEEAEHSVRRLAAPSLRDEAKQTVAMMVKTNQLEIENMAGERTGWLDCFRGTDLRRTEISTLTWATQVIGGGHFSAYLVYFFREAGLASSDAFKMGLGNTGCAFIGTILSWFLIKKFGRRPIFVIGLLWMATLWFITGGLAVVALNGHGQAKWGQAALMLVWVMSYDMTIGPLAYCIVGETSSTRLRTKTVGLSRNAFYLAQIVSAVISPYMINPLAWNWQGKAGFLWGPLSFMMAVWAFFRLPEMKGRSYYELDILFERRIPARKFAKTVIEPEAIEQARREEGDYLEH
ncbi:uncharacterized protein L199_003454 [Kwoniella botswanensis]|uniref:uncharacterized protein n=1 Tax=Kwoniella botswanensis TaxID=1268659 RepID=UPI00315DFAC5